MIIYVILMTCVFDVVVMLQREFIYWSLLGLEGVKIFCKLGLKNVFVFEKHMLDVLKDFFSLTG